ncbi:MAG: tetratricopeptide repeat protein [Nitrospirota bacterium]
MVAVWVILAGVPVPAWSQLGTAQEAVQEGMTLLQQGLTPEAIDRLRAAVDAFPDDPTAWLALGRAYEAGRRAVDAIPAYRRVIDLAPDSDSARRAASRLDQLGPDAETYRAAERAFLAGARALSAGETAAAEAELLSVIERVPKHLQTLLLLGNLAERAGREEDAEARWRTAVGVEPSFFPAQVNLGRLLERTERHGDAVAAYRAAAQTRADHPDVRFAERRLSQLGATPEQAVEVRAWMRAAEEAIRSGRVDEAQRLFERVVSVVPTQAPANLALGLIVAKRGRTVEAMGMLKRGLEGDPDFYPAWFLLAEIEAGQGLFDEAIQHYQRVVELRGPVREGVEARRRLPALEEAREKVYTLKSGLAVEARRSFSEGAEAFQRLDYEAAYRGFTRAAALDEGNPYYAFNRGLAAFNLGNTVVAARAFERVLEVLPTYGLAHFWLGVLFQNSAEQARDARSLPEAQAEYRAAVGRFDLAITNGEGAWFLEEAYKRRADAVDYLGRFEEGQGWLTVGGVLGAQGRFVDALNAFMASSQRFPYDYQPYLNVGAILTDFQEYGRAQEALERAAAVNPQSAKPSLQLGFLFEQQKRWEEALAAYRKAAELAPNTPLPYASIGTVLVHLERFDDALAAFERNVELANGTSTPIVHWNLAFYYGEQRRMALSLRHYRKVRELLANRTEKEAVDLRRSAEDAIATLEQRLRPYRLTLRATPWSYDSNLASSETDPISEVSSSVGGTMTYTLINEEQVRLRSGLTLSESSSLVYQQGASVSMALSTSGEYILSPIMEVGGSLGWSYGHGSDGPASLGQSLGASWTRRGQLPSSLTIGLSYNTSIGLGASTARNASTGYSLSLSQSLGASGSVGGSFSGSTNDANRADQVSQSKGLAVSFSRQLWAGMGLSLTYSLGFTDYVNPTRRSTVRGDTTIETLVFLQSVSKSYGVDLSYTFRSDLVISFGAHLTQNDSSFSLNRTEDIDELRNNLAQATGPYRKYTSSLSVSKTF